MLAILHFEGPGKFNPPFVLELRNTEQCSTDERDHNRRNECEHAFPDVLGFGECVDADAVKGSDHAASDDNADEDAETDAEPDLFDELLVYDTVTLWTNRLLDPCKKH